MRARQTPKPRGSRLSVRSAASLPVLVLTAGIASPAASQDAHPVCRDGEARIVGVVVDAVTEAPLRGGRVESDIYLDEMPLIGGWAELESIPTTQLYMVEIYGRGRHIRAYSHTFMQRAAKIRLLPMPIW